VSVKHHVRFLSDIFLLCRWSAGSRARAPCPFHDPTFYNWKIAILFRQNAFEQMCG
jgi:hypothetical protein